MAIPNSPLPLTYKPRPSQIKSRRALWGPWGTGRALPARLGFDALALILALSSAFAIPGALEAQQPKKIARIGYLAAVSVAADAPRLEAFRQGLRDQGYIEGQNLTIELRHEGRGFERLPELAAELVAQKPDVLVGVTTNAALALKNATTTIPIVFMGVTDKHI